MRPAFFIGAYLQDVRRDMDPALYIIKISEGGDFGFLRDLEILELALLFLFLLLINILGSNMTAMCDTCDLSAKEVSLLSIEGREYDHRCIKVSSQQMFDASCLDNLVREDIR